MSMLSLPPLSAVRPEKQYDEIMRYLFMLVEELNNSFDEAGNTVEKTVSSQLDLRFGDEFGDFAQIQADIGGIRTRVADAEGNISTVTQTVNGITISDGQGQTLINGAKIKTGTIDAEDVIISGSISWGNLSQTVKNNIYAMAYDEPLWIERTYIDFARVQSPKIVTNQLDLYARTSSGGSETGTFNMYGYWGETARSILQIGYHAGDAPYVTFGSSTFGAYSMWSFPETYVNGDVDFLQGSKVNNLQFASSDYGSALPAPGFEGQVFFLI